MSAESSLQRLKVSFHPLFTHCFPSTPPQLYVSTAPGDAEGRLLRWGQLQHRGAGAPRYAQLPHHVIVGMGEVGYMVGYGGLC
jgi:hypothetical protein